MSLIRKEGVLRAKENEKILVIGKENKRTEKQKMTIVVAFKFLKIVFGRGTRERKRVP